MAILAFRDVSYTYPNGAVALRGVSLGFEAGEYIVLTGPNGAGKSALARCANGILRPQEGEVLYHGRDIATDLRSVRRGIAVMFQSADHQFVASTVEDDVAFGPENYGYPPEEVTQRLDGAIAAMEIEHVRHKDPLLLSGGEKRRAALAGLLALDPEIIILDEPFASLDYAGVRSVLSAIRNLHARGVTIVAITHAVEKIAGEASRMILMSEGRLVGDGTPQEIVPLGREHGLPPEERPVETLTWLR
ncbi:MAG: energy-coupling factor ABC transporter ATP-binding protein [Spirochaetota bacterium]